MTAGQQIAPALAFLDGPPRTYRRQTRFSADELWLRYSVAQLGLLCLSGLAMGDLTQAGAAWVGSELAVTALLLLAARTAYAGVLRSLTAAGRLAQHVAVVGSGPASQRTVAQLERSDPLAIQIVGRYALTSSPQDGFLRGDLRTLLCDARLEVVDSIVVALEPEQATEQVEVLAALCCCIQDVFLAEDDAAPVAGQRRLGTLPVRLISQRPIRGAAATAKRAFDVATSCALLSFMAPLLLLLTTAVRLESAGPILFRQLRAGYNNRLFYIFKFRSMFVQASDRLAKQQTVRGDPRITRVGRVIRKLSLDELPQLLNVLRGEMSLVGPRPHAPGTSIGGQRVHTLVEGYARRHLLRPGITGLAQVRGLRGGLQDQRQAVDRIASDLEYIRRWSLWFDVRILLGTVLLELRDSRGI